MDKKIVTLKTSALRPEDGQLGRHIYMNKNNYMIITILSIICYFVPTQISHIINRIHRI
jgi:hypothetical protein